jgi:uncharacterized protein
MKMHQTLEPGRNLITAYEQDQIRIHQQAYSGNLIITPDCVSPWSAGAFETLQQTDFSELLQYQPEVVLFGSGISLRFPHPQLTAALTNAHIGVEVMDTRAACRCFNILMAEDRRVVMAVLQS